jgi:hypothetical protein
MRVRSDMQPEVGAEIVTARPWRAVTLAWASRMALVVGLLVVGWAVVATSSADVQQLAAGVPVARAHEVEDGPGRTPASSLREIAARVERSGARLVALDLGRPDARSAAVRIDVITSTTHAAGIDRVVTALGRSGLTAVTPTSLHPVPSGVRVSLDADLQIRVAPLPPVVDLRPVGVRIAETAEVAGVELRRLDVPPDLRSPVRLEARGDMEAVGELLERIETEHSAPLRFESVVVREVSEDIWEMVVVFRVREVESSVGGVRP